MLAKMFMMFTSELWAACDLKSLLYSAIHMSFAASVPALLPLYCHRTSMHRSTLLDSSSCGGAKLVPDEIVTVRQL